MILGLRRIGVCPFIQGNQRQFPVRKIHQVVAVVSEAEIRQGVLNIQWATPLAWNALSVSPPLVS